MVAPFAFINEMEPAYPPTGICLLYPLKLLTCPIGTSLIPLFLLTCPMKIFYRLFYLFFRLMFQCWDKMAIVWSRDHNYANGVNSYHSFLQISADFLQCFFSFSPHKCTMEGFIPQMGVCFFAIFWQKKTACFAKFCNSCH